MSGLRNILSFMAAGGNNPRVQAVINKAVADGVVLPNQLTILGLNWLFNTLESVLSDAEMIKIYDLCDIASLTSGFWKYNYLDANSNIGTAEGGGSLVYGLKGISSDGTSYINEHITIKRRANLQLNSSSIAVTNSFLNADVDQAACGVVSGNYYIIKPRVTTQASNYYFTGLVKADVIGAGAQKAFTGVSTHGAGGTRARFLQNSTFEDIASNLTVEMTNNLDIYSLCYNNAGTPLRHYTVGNLQVRWEGYELTDAKLEFIRDTIISYQAFIHMNWTADVDITADGKEVFISAGHSLTGTSDAVGVRCAPDTVLQWNRSNNTWQEVTNADLLNVPSVGSWGPRFGKDYNESTQKRASFALYGYGGSAFLNSFLPASWDNNTGTLYPTAKAVWDAAILSMGVTKPKGIFLLLGVNDINRTEPLNDLLTQVDSLISRLDADYGHAPIYLSLMSKPETGTAQQAGRANAMKIRFRQLEALYSNLYRTNNEAALFSNGLVSGTHWNYAGNDLYGRWLKAFIDNPETDKDVRRIQACTFPSVLSDAHKAAIKTFILAQKAGGNWDKLTTFQIRVASHAQNALVDIMALCTLFDHSTIVNLNDSVEYDGIAKYLDTGFDQTYSAGESSLNDIIIGVKTKAANTPQNTQAALFGQYNGTNNTLIRQNTANGIDWWINSTPGNVTTYTGVGKIPANSHIAIRRMAASGSGCVELLINNVVVQSGSAPSNSISSRVFFEGCYNNNGTPADFWDGETELFWAAKNTGLDLNILFNGPGGADALIAAFKS